MEGGLERLCARWRKPAAPCMGGSKSLHCPPFACRSRGARPPRGVVVARVFAPIAARRGQRPTSLEYRPVIIVMNHGAPQASIDRVVSEIERMGSAAHLSRGKFRTVIGAVGEESALDQDH